MKTGDRPPPRQKKGIQVMQPPRPHPKLSTGLTHYESGSMKSLGRTRGISTSRESGITIDKIYDAKHFLPPKSPQQSIKKSECEDMRTLTSVRSLKLISVCRDEITEMGSQA